ncbi:hypothetical protein PUN28_018077 [Cardiocondyla obscurior]|uniref:Uncharacterized protein n=1 Tax=Cardiocondyla obscurior TaxID=286306 RepID=A0AAW2EJJ4_9HYME
MSRWHIATSVTLRYAALISNAKTSFSYRNQKSKRRPGYSRQTAAIRPGNFRAGRIISAVTSRAIGKPAVPRKTVAGYVSISEVKLPTVCPWATLAHALFCLDQFVTNDIPFSRRLRLTPLVLHIFSAARYRGETAKKEKKRKKIMWVYYLFLPSIRAFFFY